MDNIERLLAELALNNFESESLHWVDVVHVVTPINFYVRPIKYNKLVASYKTMTPSTKFTTIKINDMVIYNLSFRLGQSNYFRRGRVSQINIVNDHVECDIFTIDHGFTDKSVPIEYLWQCSPDLLNTPALAYNSQLANCFPVRTSIWTEYATQVFRRHLGRGRVKMSVLGRTSSKLVVKLMNSNLDDVATLLAISGFSDVGSYYDCIPWKPLIVRKRITFNFKKVFMNERLRVRMLSGRSFEEFYVKEVEDYEKLFLKDIHNITFYARREFSLIPAHLIEGAIICAKDDEKNMYHRAIIKKVTKLESTAILQLVDWGRDEEFAVSKMKYMSKQALNIPLTTIFCKSANYNNQAWVKDIENFLSSGFEFYITIKRLGHEFECPHTVDISPIEDESCLGATALPEETKQNTNIEIEYEICQGASSCAGNTVKRRPFGYGEFEYLSTPDISPHSEEENNCQGTITWQKLITKRRVPYKGVNYKYVLPKTVKTGYKNKSAHETGEGPSSFANEHLEIGNEEYEFEFSNITDASIATEIEEMNITGISSNIIGSRRRADNLPKDYKITKSSEISKKHEMTEAECGGASAQQKSAEAGNTVEEQSKSIENLDLNFKCLNLENNTKESGEKKINSEEHTDLVKESID
ncbi:unnamed protein product, partial [Brenthis ino]